MPSCHRGLREAVGGIVLYLMNHIEELTKLFTKFPGIGPRVARRFAYFILRSNAGYVQSLASAMMNIQKNVRLCPVSFAYYFPDGYNTEYSPIILDPSHDHSTMMIIEKETDIEIIEKSKFWNGNYFVLVQLAPLIDTDLEEKIRLSALRDIITKRAEKMSVFPGSQRNTLVALIRSAAAAAAKDCWL